MRSNDWSCARSMHSTTCSRSGCSPRRQPMTSANGRATFSQRVGVLTEICCSRQTRSKCECKILVRYQILDIRHQLKQQGRCLEKRGPQAPLICLHSVPYENIIFTCYAASVCICTVTFGKPKHVYFLPIVIIYLLELKPTLKILK